MQKVPAQTARVLLVDDEDAITSTLGPHLERAGFEVIVAHDGEEALQRHSKSAPDIVV